jgi:hypothetical protein
VPLDMEALADVIDRAVERRLAPIRKENEQLKARIAELESRAPIPGPQGDPGADGRSLTADDVLPIIEALQAKHALELERRMMDRVDRIEVRDGIDGKDGHDGTDGAPGMDGRDGKDADEEVIARRVLEIVSKAAQEDVQKAIAAIPAPVHGRDGIDGKDGADGRDGVDGKDGAPGVDGRDGQDADEDAIVERVLPLLRKEVEPVLKSAVSEEVAKIPLPQDGKDGRDGMDGKSGADGLNGKDGQPGGKGIDGRDGQDATPAMVDASVAKYLEPITARLELNLERKTFEWMDRIRDEAHKMIESIPRPKDGKDGIGVKDVAIEYDGARKVTLRHQTEGGEVVKEIYLPVPLYLGVWKADAAYSTHDLVTHDGSTWIATQDSKGVRPGHMQKAWKLIVKKGRDGK